MYFNNKKKYMSRYFMSDIKEIINQGLKFYNNVKDAIEDDEE